MTAEGSSSKLSAAAVKPKAEPGHPVIQEHTSPTAEEKSFASKREWVTPRLMTPIEHVEAAITEVTKAPRCSGVYASPLVNRFSHPWGSHRNSPSPICNFCSPWNGSVMGPPQSPE